MRIPVRKRFLAPLLVALLALAPATAESAMMRVELGPADIFDRMAQIFSTLQMLMDFSQEYEKPQLLPNGDIIIRRKRPEPPAPSEPERTDGKKT